MVNNKAFPANILQYAFEYKEWWQKEDTLQKGSLIWAVIPYFETTPLRLVPLGRSEATNHNSARLKVEPYRVDSRNPQNHLPVAGLTLRQGENFGFWKAKTRPALVLRVNEANSHAHVKYQRKSTILIAPYYGLDDSKGSYPKGFVAEVKQGDYAQYMWDLLPIGSEKKGSLLRFDRTLSIARTSRTTYQHTGFSLTEEAVGFLDEWMVWFCTGELDQETFLYEMISELRKHTDPS